MLLIPGATKKSLDNVSFEMPAGKNIALVGASGSGKSTAASLIPRFYDVREGSGEVGGVDVRDMTKLRKGGIILIWKKGHSGERYFVMEKFLRRMSGCVIRLRNCR